MSEIQLTEEEQKEYLKVRGNRCPFKDCLSGSIMDSGSIVFNYPDKVLRRCKCRKCGRTWKEIYTLSGVTAARDCS